MKQMQDSITSARNEAENSTKVEDISFAHYIRNTVLVAGSFVGNCADNINWYVGIYSQGAWIYNSCSYCGKRENV